MPSQFLEWADAHQELLERVVSVLTATGTWPLLADLTRDFVRLGNPIPVEAVIFDMPQPLRFRTPPPERAVLSLFGLRLSKSGGVLLAGFYATLAVARMRFEAEDKPILTSQDVGQIAVQANAHPGALMEIVEREAPFLGSTTPQSSAAVWIREIGRSVVNYWHAETIDDFLRIRAEELRRSPTWHWPSGPEEPEAGHAEGVDDGARSVFISHAGEDKADVARPIAEGLVATGWKVWLDEYELTVGDSLFEDINHGLARSMCGVVVLSESFFAKHWPKRELEALAAKESTSGEKVILPVWHGIDAQYLAFHAPMLADRLGVSTTGGIPYVVEQLTRALVKGIEPGKPPGSSTVFSSALTRARPASMPATPGRAVTTPPVPVLVLAPSFQHRLSDPHQVTATPQVIWAQSALVQVENVGTTVAFIRSAGADPLGAGTITVKPPTAIAPGTTRPVELVVGTISADASVAAGQIVRFWLDYGSDETATRRLWAVTRYDGDAWTNVGSENRPLDSHPVQ
jgi:TIR domain-containing protein